MRILLPLFLVVLFSASGVAGELPRATPAEVGLDPDVLARIDAQVAKLLEEKAFPGATVAIARNGKVAYLKAFGTFQEDSLIRIYSMSKPITVAAALMLVDEGKLKLDDPVATYIPGFDKLRVLGADETPRTMTVQHLMQHTAGLTYGIFGNTPVDEQYRKKEMLAAGSTLEEMTTKLVGTPLLFAPGERWHYSVSIDVLGRVIEVASKQSFDQFLRQRLFEPLGMDDTSFSVPDDKLKRFVPCCGPQCRVIEATETSRFRTQPALLSGGGGLVSTLADYLTFALMLEAGGEWKGKRILKAETVARMTTNQLPAALVPIRFGAFPMVGVGFGLGVSVRVQEAGTGTREGAWGWGGAASTTFFVSPKDRLTVVTMIQRMPMWNGLDRAVRSVVFEALKTPVTAGGR